MKDNTKKWMVTAGLVAVCTGLIFGISAVLYHEPAHETLGKEKETGDVEITVDIGKAGIVRTGEKEDPSAYSTEKTGTETGAETEETLVIVTDTGMDVPDSAREQAIQPKPERTEKEKPSGPPVLPEGGDAEETQTQPDDEEAATQPPAGEDAPKTGDAKDGKVYVEGFGWLPDEGQGSGIYAGDMYENGNKIGIMD